ncbi:MULTISPECIES: hypothetical protein [unclassified Desulfovibrio]|uniref:hypothetical protein n=1 Tax=unclassified Desulfovibrio TaxID=2593640 RepID=UPI002FDAF103
MKCLLTKQLALQVFRGADVSKYPRRAFQLFSKPDCSRTCFKSSRTRTAVAASRLCATAERATMTSPHGPRIGAVVVTGKRKTL